MSLFWASVSLSLLLNVLVGEGLGALDLMLDLVEPVHLLGLEELLGGLVGLVVELLAHLAHLLEPLLAFQALRFGGRDLLADLRRPASLAFSIWRRRASAPAERWRWPAACDAAAARRSPAAAAALLGHGRDGQECHQTESDDRLAQHPHRVKLPVQAGDHVPRRRDALAVTSPSTKIPKVDGRTTVPAPDMPYKRHPRPIARFSRKQTKKCVNSGRVRIIKKCVHAQMCSNHSETWVRNAQTSATSRHDKRRREWQTIADARSSTDSARAS